MRHTLPPTGDTSYVYVEVYITYIPGASEISTEAMASKKWGGFWGEAGVMEGRCRGAWRVSNPFMHIQTLPTDRIPH